MGVGLAVSLSAQATQSAKPEIKRVPTPDVDVSNGKQMYAAYCASCHGLSGLGNGPAAPALKAAPTNLTELAKSNGGKFPEVKVQQQIKGDAAMPLAHGSKEMPIWGPVFSMIGARNGAQAQLRVHNLTEYIQSLQKK